MTETRTFQVTYVSGPRTFTVVVEAADSAAAALQGRFAVMEAHKPLGLTDHYGLGFRGRYEIASVKEVL